MSDPIRLPVNDLLADLDRVTAERDALAAQVARVRALRDEWLARDRDKPYAMDHVASLADDLDAALDGTDTGEA